MRWQHALAWALAAFGGGWLAWAAVTLGWRRWLDLDAAPPRPPLPALVLSGPFAVVRHPQSLGLLCLLAAAALYRAAWGKTAVLAAAAAVVVWLARRDERGLQQRFGAAYARYQRAVPGLMPGLW